MSPRNSSTADGSVSGFPAPSRTASADYKKGKSRPPRRFEERFANIDFERLGLPPDIQKDKFLAALWKLRDFRGRGFSFNRLCNKIISLFRYTGESRKTIQLWIYHALSMLAEHRMDTVYGDVLGMAGEISGIYEAIFKQKTTLAGIKLGRFAEVEMTVLDAEGIGIKEFDAVGTEVREGGGNAIVTVFEFKFALSLRKLYEQVIGIDSAKHPHLVVLTEHKQFEQVRNLVYFGEVGDGYMTRAIRQFISKTSWLAGHTKVRGKGYSIRFSLPEIGEFLCDQYTIRLARRIGRPFIPVDPDSPRYRIIIGQMRTIINRKMQQERSKPNAKFDVIIAVSNAPRLQLAGIKKLINENAVKSQAEERLSCLPPRAGMSRD